MTRQKLTPPQVARLWGVSVNKIHTFIRKGELRAFDISTNRGGRPRYLIDVQAVADFEERRAVRPQFYPKKPRRSREDVIQYF